MTNGGIIGPKNNISRGIASGVFSINEQLQARRNSLWPAVPTYTYIGNYINTTDGTSFAFSGINVASSGLIVFSVSTDVGTALANSLTVNGIAATKVIETTAAVAATSLWYLEVPPAASTTLSVTVSTSATAARLVLGVYRINDYSFVAPIAQKSNNAIGAISSVSLTTDSLQTNSVLIVAYVNTNASTTTFTGVSEDFDAVTTENASTHAGGSVQVVGGGAVAITVDSSAGGNLGLVSAAWR
jgi:hypothetical protein